MKIHYPVFHLSSPFFFFSASHFSLSPLLLFFFQRPRIRRHRSNKCTASLSILVALNARFVLVFRETARAIEGRLRVPVRSRVIKAPSSKCYVGRRYGWPFRVIYTTRSSLDTFSFHNIINNGKMEEEKSVKTTVFTEYFSLHSGTMLGYKLGCG